MVPLTGSTSPQEAAHWAAWYAGGHEHPYGIPTVHDEFATVEMPPHVPVPASHGFQWYPFQGLTRLAQDDPLLKQIAKSVWKAYTWNTWRAWAFAYALGSVVAALFYITADAAAKIGSTDALFIAAPAIALAVLALKATAGNRFAVLPRITAVLGLGIAAVKLASDVWDLVLGFFG